MVVREMNWCASYVHGGTDLKISYHKVSPSPGDTLQT